MAAFEYIALTAAGKKKKGVMEGDSARQIRQQLREQQMMPVEINEVVEKQKKARPTLGGGISTADMALMMRQTSTLVASGMPLEECLLAVGQQSEKARVKSMVMAIRSRVLEGHSFAKGLGDFPNVFNDLYRATIAAGEHSGHLDLVLERLADYAEARQALKQKAQVALIYPSLLVTVAFVVIGVLMTYVVPQVIQTFSRSGQELPTPTKILVFSSDFLQAHGGMLLIALGALIAFAVITFRRPGPKTWLHGVLLRLPLVGKLTRGGNAARFARTLSILIASGVPVLEALKVSGEVVTNLPMKFAVEEATVKVREGIAIHKALAPSKLFPPMMLHLIANGEASGKLEAMLDKAAHTQERELDTTISSMLGLMEPLLILIMGSIVLFIVLAMLMPIFQLNQLIG